MLGNTVGEETCAAATDGENECQNETVSNVGGPAGVLPFDVEAGGGAGTNAKVREAGDCSSNSYTFYGVSAFLIAVLFILSSFLALVVLACAAIFWYLWSRLVRDTTGDGKMLLRNETWALVKGACTCNANLVRPRILTLVLWLAFILALVGSILSRSVGYTSSTTSPIVVIGYNLLGLFVVLFVAVWIMDFADLLNMMRMRKRTPECYRQKVARIKAGLALSIFAAMSVSALVSGYAVPSTVMIEIPSVNLPLCMDGYRIALIADLHLGPLADASDSRRVVDFVNSEDVDAVLFVGDIGDQTVNEALVEKMAPFKDNGGMQSYDGTFFVPGNHENYNKVSDYRALLPGYNMTMLENKYAAISPRRYACSQDEEIIFLGVSDPSLSSAPGEEDEGYIPPDFNAAVNGVSENAPKILLMHQPLTDTFEKASNANVDLVCSGHTHGGQIWPQHALLLLGKFVGVSGLFQRKETFMYISEGFVGWGPRTRLFSWPEQTIIVLRNAEKFEQEGKQADTSTTAAQAWAFVALFSLGLSLAFIMLSVSMRLWMTFAKSRRSNKET